jgi:hypothetical protein
MPVVWIKISSSDAHGESRPDDGLDVHLVPVEAIELTYQPVQPLEVDGRPEMSYTNIHVMSQPDTCRHGGADGLWRIKTGGLLPHQQQAMGWGLFEEESIRKVEVRIEKNHFLSGRAEEYRIRDLAPAWVSFTKSLKVFVATEVLGFSVLKLILGVDGPAMSPGLLAQEKFFGESSLIFRRIGDQVKFEGLKAVLEQAFQAVVRVAE